MNWHAFLELVINFKWHHCHGVTTEEGNCSYLLPLSHRDCAGLTERGLAVEMVMMVVTSDDDVMTVVVVVVVVVVVMMVVMMMMMNMEIMTKMMMVVMMTMKLMTDDDNIGDDDDDDGDDDDDDDDDNDDDDDDRLMINTFKVGFCKSKELSHHHLKLNWTIPFNILLKCDSRGLVSTK